MWALLPTTSDFVQRLWAHGCPAHWEHGERSRGNACPCGTRLLAVGGGMVRLRAANTPERRSVRAGEEREAMGGTLQPTSPSARDDVWTQAVPALGPVPATRPAPASLGSR